MTRDGRPPGEEAASQDSHDGKAGERPAHIFLFPFHLGNGQDGIHGQGDEQGRSHIACPLLGFAESRLLIQDTRFES